MLDEKQYSTEALKELYHSIVEMVEYNYLGGTYSYNQNLRELNVTWTGPASSTSVEPVERKAHLATISDDNIASYWMKVHPKFVLGLLELIFMQRNALQDKFMMMEAYARNLSVMQEKAEKFEQYVNAINVAEWEAKTGKEFPCKLKE